MIPLVTVMNIGWGVIGQALVLSFIVVDFEVVVQAMLQSRDGRILLDINVFVLDAAP